MTDNEVIKAAVDRFHNLSGRELSKLQDLNTKIQNHKGKWGTPEGGESTASGAVLMYWVDNDPLIREFIAFMEDNDLLPIFNWPEWDKGSDLFSSADPNKYDNIDLKTALKIVYAAIRKERFADGTLAWAFESGGFPKLVNRLVELGATQLE